MTEVLWQALRAAPTGRVALADERRELTYGALPGLVDTDAAWLGAHGARRVALLADNGCAWALADLALLRAGLLAVPLPTFFSPAQHAHVLADAGVDAVLTDRAASFQAAHAGFELQGHAPSSGLALLRRANDAPAPPLDAGLCKITYTSGSTAAPKGVCLDARTLLTVATSLAGAVRGADVTRHLGVLPLSTLLENLGAIYVPLLLGATSRVPSLASTGMAYGSFDAQRFVGAIAASGAHSLVLVPELLRVLLPLAGKFGPLPDLRFLAVGGAATPVPVLEAAREFGLPVYEGYGLSECASVVCLNTPAANRLGSVGRPLPHARVRIDERGQILVAGAGMRGYLGEPPRTDEWLATGDLGEIDADGFVHVRGRLRNLIVTSMGRNIAPEWVESELTADPAIAHAMVVGEGRPWPAALLATRGDPPPARVAAAVERANARLPEYARVRRWHVLAAPPTPQDGSLTANGRLRRDAMLRRHSQLVEDLYA
jgi:long-subunit acyl-CoA synthetase (AMP-forming)